MTIEHDDLRRFKDAYLDYLEGDRDDPPALEDLPEEQRPTAEAFIESITAARGVDPYASRPSIEQLLPGSLRSTTTLMNSTKRFRAIYDRPLIPEPRSQPTRLRLRLG